MASSTGCFASTDHTSRPLQSQQVLHARHWPNPRQKRESPGQCKEGRSHFRRRSPRARDSAEYRQHHPALRQYGRAAATIRPLGFRLDDRSLRRAGLDYDALTAVRLHADFAACLAALRPARWLAISTGVDAATIPSRSHRAICSYSAPRREVCRPPCWTAVRRTCGCACRCARRAAASIWRTRRRGAVRGLAPAGFCRCRQSCSALTARCIRACTATFGDTFSYSTR